MPIKNDPDSNESGSFILIKLVILQIISGLFSRMHSHEAPHGQKQRF